MNWFLLSFSSTVLWGSTNFIDKYLISKYFQKRGISVLLIFSSLIGLFLLPIIFLINRDVVNIPLHDIFILIASGVIYVFAIFPYLLALREEDTSLVVPTFQAIPVFSYFLALLFLNEKLVVWQIIASLLIIFGAIGMSVDFKAKKRFFRWKVFFLMIASSFLYSLNLFLFKFVERDSSFWTTSFWEYTGFAMAALCLLLITKYRKEFWQSFKTNGTKVLGINALYEIINIVGKIIFNFASLLAPLALVQVVNGAQPLVVLFMGVILTIFFPKIIKEDISWKMLSQKLIFIILILGGVYLLNR